MNGFLMLHVVLAPDELLPIFVNPARIVYVRPERMGVRTYIDFGGAEDGIFVTEDFVTVTKMIWSLT